MSRWHQSCDRPDVYVDGDGVPRCRSCEASAEALLKASRVAVSSSIPPIPEDEAPGNLNLWWPPTVPYKGARPEDARAKQVDDGQAEESPREEPGTERHEPHPVYGHTLAADEFRLLCLGSSPDPQTATTTESAAPLPVHFTLDTYKHDNCPEYETVSYTWAGEDGNGALDSPVFVGPYWDVLMATRNCAAMLRHLRPWRGVRALWVDAVCINQADVAERGGQVAKMDRIYSECARVVVWLGEDVVERLPAGRHARRGGLHELLVEEVEEVEEGKEDEGQGALDDGGGTSAVADEKGEGEDATPKKNRPTIRQLLSRRYFSRVWVIQELILSRRALFLIGPSVLEADSSLSRAARRAAAADWSWADTDAPWVHYLGHQSFPADRSFADTLALTAKSRASDPRDKLFGVLALFGMDAETRALLRPDYALSCGHVFVGLFAHCILRQKDLWLLFKAVGTAASGGGGGPSWVPGWRTEEAWMDVFEQPVEVSEPWSTLETWINKEAVVPWNEIIRFTNATGRKNPVHKLRPWKHHASIASSTGALSLNLTRLATLTTPLSAVRQVGPVLHLHGARVSPTHDLFFWTRHPDLHALSRAGDEVFVLNPGSASASPPLTYLLLRPLAATDSTTEKTKKKKHTYALVAACAHVFLAKMHRELAHKLRIHLEPRVHPAHPLETLQGAGETADIELLARQVGMRLDSGWFGRELSAVFPQGAGPRPSGAMTVGRLVPVCLACLAEQAHKPELSSGVGFEQAYLQAVDAAFKPRIADGYVELTFGPEEWACAKGDYTTPESTWQWRKDGSRISGSGGDWKDVLSGWKGEAHRRLLRGDAAVVVRWDVASLRDTVWSLAQSLQLQDLYRLGYGAGPGGGYDLLARLRAGPQEEDRFRASWFQKPVEYREACLDGSTFQVHIE